MGRGRGKGKKMTVTSHEDPGSGSEEPLPAYRRRGRPQKPLKDDVDEEEAEKIEEEEEEEEEGNEKLATPNKEVKGPVVVENGRKRKRYSKVKENSDTNLEENGAGVKSNSEKLPRKNGFRQNGSRRKSKPRRAAEAGVECQ